MFALVQLFLDFLQKNIMVTIVVLAVVSVRLLLKKFPKKYSFVLWSFVGIRMVFDSFVSSGISLFSLIGANYKKVLNPN